MDAFDLPGSADDDTPVTEVSLDAYADRICRALAAHPEPAVLVGHSMDGIAITQAAARCPQHVAECDVALPDLRTVTQDHRARCILVP